MHASLKKKKRIDSCLKTDLTLRHKKADALSRVSVWSVVLRAGRGPTAASPGPRQDRGPTAGKERPFWVGAEEALGSWDRGPCQRHRGGDGCFSEPPKLPPVAHLRSVGCGNTSPGQEQSRSGKYGECFTTECGRRGQWTRVPWDTPSPRRCLVARSCPSL